MSRLVFALVLFSFSLNTARAQGVITTVAGTDWVFPGDGKPAVQAPLGITQGVAVDRNGVAYVSDTLNQIVGRIDPDGILRVVAGNGVAGFSGDGGPATSASLYQPTGLAFDAAGNLYIADSGNYVIRKVLRDGTITTIAGTGETGFAGDGGPATSASLDLVQGLAVANDGTLYLADNASHRVRRISPNGIITTVAGNGRIGFSGDNGPAAQASLDGPVGIALDAAGNLYIADSGNHRIRKVTPGGIISTFLGGSETFPGFGQAATAVSANCPAGVAVDSDGTVYVASVCGSLVLKVGPDGIVRAFAGTENESRYRGDRIPAVQAALDPWALAVDPVRHTVYITGNERLFRVATDVILTSIAGNNRYRFTPDGTPALQAYLNEPFGVATDAAGNLYIADAGNNRIRRVSRDGAMTTIAGNDIPFGDFSGDGGPAAGAGLSYPIRVRFDAAGNLYIADFFNHRVRRIGTDGRISTVAGNGEEGFSGDGRAATQASLALPVGLAFDAAGNLFIADLGNHRVRKVTPAGIISTVAGTGEPGFSGDGGQAAQARLQTPAGLAIDGAGNLYIADEDNHRIRKVTPGGIISTVAGTGTEGFSGDGGLATSARLAFASDVFVLPDGTLYIADTQNTRVRRVDVGGRISTVAGNGDYDASGDGGPPLQAGVGEVKGLTVDSVGNLYISSRGTNRVRAVLVGAPSFTASPATLSFTAKSGGAVSDGQTIALSSATNGLAFSVGVGSASWLRVTPGSGVLPAILTVTVDPSSLSAGTMQGTITVTAPNATPSTRTIAVTVTVAASDPPKLSLETQALSFSLLQGSGTASAQVTVSNRGGGSLAFTAAAATTSGGAWLSLTPASGTVTPNSSAPLTVTADAGTLAPGTYTGTITVTAGAQTLQVPVTFSVASSTRTILLSQTGLTFTAVAQGGQPLPQAAGVLNTGSGSMNWQGKASTLSGGQGWLTISVAEGTVARPFLDVSPFDVQVNPTGLAPGDYYGQVQVTAPGAANSPQTISVVLNVLPAGSNPGPEVRASGLVFTGLPGSSPSSQSVLVSNLMASPVSYASARVTQDGANWLAHLPGNAIIAPSPPGRIVVQPDFTRLAPGIYRGAITLLFNDNSATIRNVSILSVVAPSGATAASKPGSGAAAGNCTPKVLLPQMTSLPQGFTVPASQPVSMQVKVVDDCGDVMESGVVVARFSTNDSEVSMVPVGGGVWSGTWQPRDTTQPQIRVGVYALLVRGNLRVGGEFQISGQVRSGAATPLVAPGAVLNAASFVSNSAVAPGTLISIFGVRLAEGQNAASLAPLPTELGGTQVLLGGRPLPLRYTSDGQVNAQVPYDLAINTRHQLLVRRGVSLSVPEDVTVAAAQPAVFSLNQTGKGQGVITGLDGLVADPGRGLRAGDAVVIYCEGLGAVTPAVQEGAAAPSSPPAATTSPVSVTIGGRDAQVLFAGLTPGFAGLYQVNAIVPAGLGVNNAAQVVLTVAGQTSPPVTMAVR